MLFYLLEMRVLSVGILKVEAPSRWGVVVRLSEELIESIYLREGTALI